LVPVFLLRFISPDSMKVEECYHLAEITYNDQATQKLKIQVQVESFVRTLL
jgi:hypothetical protein